MSIPRRSNPGKPTSRTISTPALGDVLSRILGPRGLKKRVRTLDQVRSAWVAVAGDDVPEHTRVTSVRNGVVTIEVDSPPLCHQLAGFHKYELLLRLKERVKQAEVTELRFRLGAFTRD